MLRSFMVTAALTACLASTGLAQKKPTREQQVRKDRQAFANNEAWIYDDLKAATEEANRSQRPMIIVFR